MENIVKNLPEKPGCYLYKNKDNKIIYVGKAKNLKKRVSSYFNKAHNFKTTQLVRDIVDIETIITENEKESLILEQNLIKKYRPRYNIVLNDDKKYPYIAITKEKDPQYLYTRNYDNKSQISFGPLPDGTNARNILKTLERIYPLRRCKGNLGKPCIHFHIDQCSGACFKNVESIYYENQIENVKNFFNRTNDDFKNKLEEKMFIASDNLQFEEAQRIKDIINHLNFSAVEQFVDFNDNLNRDVFNYYSTEEYICFVVLFYRSGKLILKDQIIIKNKVEDIDSLFENFIMQIYSKNMLPDYIVIPQNLRNTNLNLLFKDKIAYGVDEASLRILELAKNNATEYIRQEELYKNQKSISKEELLNKLQKVLKLPKYPYHIEMFDVANILDEFVTGAMVVFKGGQPSFNDFRKYNIIIEEKGDFQRMQNMVYRRYQKDIAENNNLPDLIIMDGGKIQVHAAKSQLDILDLNIPVIGLVKNDKHKTEYIFDLGENEIILDKTNEVFRFLESIQNRVHNYAISSFRKKHAKSFTKDDLSSIKGVGEKMIIKINKSYPSRIDFYNASDEDILKIVKKEDILIAIREIKNKIDNKK
ncbi:excinuclease ABC subunit UvrC [Spiroplasma diminutum]|uniref:UvrABC system protein C n=1 Tax=Spiroplasma diminutum CUAS-1 TaxID=1276221 RepID=S5LZB0_9MOLU|nr:excinuclease ABC subunit UvrC [Spiroplasma diminutum]AGR41916.1 excinuclease ABC subunit C [Spiroplasma diminutum CUAS-1]